MKIIRNLYYIVFLVLLFSFPVFATSVEEPTTEHPKTTEYKEEPSREPDLVSNAAIVIDADSGQILYEKNINKKKYPASITKILTVLIALEHNVDFDDTITMSENAIWDIERDSTHIALDVDEKISVRDCIYATLLQSANECAYALAEYVAGDLDSFIILMNERAKELGCKNTNFVTPNGLHDRNHYTTAYDMSLITQEAVKNEQFCKIVSTLSYEIPPTNLKDETRPLWQGNRMINPNSSMYYEYCKGGKTGYTEKANNTLVTFAEKDGLKLICVVLDCDGWQYSYTDTRALYNFCYNNYTFFYPLMDISFDPKIKNSTLDNAVLNNYYTSLDHDFIELKVDTKYPLLVHKSLDTTKINYEINLFNKEKKGSIGEIIFYYEDQTLGTTTIQKDTSLLSSKIVKKNKKSNKSYWKIIVKVFIYILVVLIVCIILFIISIPISSMIRGIRRNHNRRRRYKRYRKKHDDLFYF